MQSSDTVCSGASPLDDVPLVRAVTPDFLLAVFDTVIHPAIARAPAIA
jgi:hypothetical protein